MWSIKYVPVNFFGKKTVANINQFAYYRVKPEDNAFFT